MPNLREIWHFKPQNALHQGMLNPSIANFFAILLQYIAILGSGGTVIEVEGRWRRKLEKKKKRKNIFYCVDILFL